MVSANPIVGIDVSESKREMGIRLGLTHFINAEKTDDLLGAVREIVGSAGADVVVDTTGKARVIETAYDLTHADGRTILVGVPTKGDNVTIYTLPLHFKKVLTGSHGGSSEPHLEIPRYIKLCEAGRMSLDGLITNEFGIDDINEAIDLVKSGHAGRVLVNLD
jgi:S-(hydroxymethyl)glutathione dehydrogenase/alcohol dehydrogenase